MNLAVLAYGEFDLEEREVFHVVTCGDQTPVQQGFDYNIVIILPSSADFTHLINIILCLVIMFKHQGFSYRPVLHRQLLDESLLLKRLKWVKVSAGLCLVCYFKELPYFRFLDKIMRYDL